MTLDLARIGLTPQATGAYHQLSPQRLQTLVAPEDDMWATFADIATPYSITYGTQLVGRFSVDDDKQLHGFFVDEEFEEGATELFKHVVDELNIAAAIASTVDPLFLSLSLAAGGVARPVALMYDCIAQAGSDETIDLRLAASADHEAAVAFYGAETGSPEGFLSPYLAERIASKELYLVEAERDITAVGECRLDKRASGRYAHLGLVVAAALRGQGVGTRIMNTLTRICRDSDLTPKCSTEPSNLAAQKAIRRAGFRNRHWTFRVALTEPETVGDSQTRQHSSSSDEA